MCHIVGIGICDGGLDSHRQAANPSGVIHKSDVIATKVVHFRFDFLVVPNFPECNASLKEETMPFSRFI